MGKVATTCPDCGRRGEEEGPEGIVHKTKTCRWCQAEGVLKTGTRIRFIQTLDCPANEEHPAFLFAEKGESGKITGSGTQEGYWATSDSNPKTPFGVSREEFEIV